MIKKNTLPPKENNYSPSPHLNYSIIKKKSFLLLSILAINLNAQSDNSCVEIQGEYYMETDAKRWEGNIWAGRRGPFPYTVRQCANQYSAYMNLKDFFAPHPPFSAGLTHNENGTYSYITTVTKDPAGPKKVAMGSLVDSDYAEKLPIPMQALYLGSNPALLQDFKTLLSHWKLFDSIRYLAKSDHAYNYSSILKDRTRIHEVMATAANKTPASSWVIFRLTVLEAKPKIAQKILLEIRDFYPPTDTSYTDIKYEFEAKTFREINEIPAFVIDIADSADLIYIKDTRTSLGITKATYQVKKGDSIPFSASTPSVTRAAKTQNDLNTKARNKWLFMAFLAIATSATLIYLWRRKSTASV